MSRQRSPNLDIFNFKKFDVETLRVNSSHLKGNPLKDPHIRKNPVLVPKGKAPTQGWPVVFVLAGFTGNGTKYFSVKTFELNMPEVIDKCCAKGEAPQAIYVFVEAMTFWGGSQFLNSSGTGKYESYVAKDIVSAVKKNYKVNKNPNYWCVMGGSSGGYGALHLSTSHPKTFAVAAAIAPDSFFEHSLIPDLYAAAPLISKIGIDGIKEEMKSGRFFRRKEWHSVMNAVAMSACYSGGRSRIQLPINVKTGEINKTIWKKWQEKDPVYFLKKRKPNLKKLHRVFLDVGTKDQYNLQFGARQIHKILKSAKVPHDYSEFDGNHFDIGERRPFVWKWLTELWS